MYKLWSKAQQEALKQLLKMYKKNIPSKTFIPCPLCKATPGLCSNCPWVVMTEKACSSINPELMFVSKHLRGAQVDLPENYETLRIFRIKQLYDWIKEWEDFNEKNLFIHIYNSAKSFFTRT